MPEEVLQVVRLALGASDRLMPMLAKELEQDCRACNMGCGTADT